MQQHEDHGDPGSALEQIAKAQRQQGYAIVLLTIGLCFVFVVTSLAGLFKADQMLVGKMLIIRDDKGRDRIIIGATGDSSHFTIKSAYGDSRIMALVSSEGSQITLFGPNGNPAIVIRGARDGDLQIEKEGEHRNVAPGAPSMGSDP